MDVWTSILNVADTVAVLGLCATLVLFIIENRRATRVEKQENYITLEMASNDLFQFEGEHGKALAPFKSEHYAPTREISDNETLADAFYFSTLNLFEISLRLREDKTIPEDVFGSWVMWFYDTLIAEYFRAQWPDYRDNYTPALRDIFDKGCATYNDFDDHFSRQKAFFDIVSKRLDCPIVKTWLTEPPADTRRIEEPKAGHHWVRLDHVDLDELGQFFSANIKADAAYISHSEYFEGYSPDAKIWVDNLEEKFTLGLGEFDDHNTDVLLIRDEALALKAAAILVWDTNGHEKYGTISDMTVGHNFRRQGLGQTLMSEIKSRALDVGAERLVLESGIGNHGAHGLFEKQGFKPLSKVYHMPLGE